MLIFKKKRFLFFIFILVSLHGTCYAQVKTKAKAPNILFIYIDDMGYADLSTYGNHDIETPNIDRLAKEGIKFTNFSVASPVCSPSRAGIITGHYPARYQITDYIDSRSKNKERNEADYLDSSAPTIAKAMKKAGYATAHIGKWHLGGGRDIGDVPLPETYGYDKTLVAFEGLGNRVLIKDFDFLNTASSKLGHGNITWVTHDWQKTPMFVDTTIAFIHQHSSQPFYVELWLNDVHDPFDPKPEAMDKFKRFANNKYLQQYYAVLYEVDQQIGRLLKMLDRTGLSKNTIVVLSSDNGPTDWPRYYKEHYAPPGSVGFFRGRKWSLYEGGIREPFLVRWPGHVPAGKVDSTTIVNGIDLLPTLCKMSSVSPIASAYDGEDMSQAILGRSQKRKKPLMFVYGLSPYNLKPATPQYRSPGLAIRDEDWKLLVNHDGSNLELYNLKTDIAESENVAQKYPDIAQRLSRQVLNWWQTMPK
jgi:arylsulfatase A-like enzyme